MRYAKRIVAVLLLRANSDLQDQPTRTLLASGRAVVFIVCLGLTAPHLQAQPTGAACDPELTAPPNDPLGYRLRGARCEGVYHVQKVSGTGGLTLASLTGETASTEIRRGEPLVITWVSPAPAEVRLRAAGLRRQLHYRMDARSETGDATFAWPTDVLTALEMGVRDVGISASIDHRVGDRTERVYLPVRWGEGSSSDASGRYEVVVVPGMTLDEVYVSLAAVTDVDSPDAGVLLRNKPLQYGLYPAERPVRVTLPQLGRTGIYRLQLAALQRGGSSSTASLYFFHAAADH